MVTYAIDVSLDINADSEDEAYAKLKRALIEGDVSLINDWFVEDMHPYGPEEDDIVYENR